MQIRPLRGEDDRTRFSSGDLGLDRFFRTYAGQNQFRFHVGVTYVAVEDETILGFATVAPGHIEFDSLPTGVKKRLPNYPLPILRLARLAVDQAAQSRGVGTSLLRYVLTLATRMSQDFGCIGVVVDAKPGAVAFYKRYGFTAIEALEGATEARPQPTPMFLSLKEILSAQR